MLMATPMEVSVLDIWTSVKALGFGEDDTIGGHCVQGAREEL